MLSEASSPEKAIQNNMSTISHLVKRQEATEKSLSEMGLTMQAVLESVRQLAPNHENMMSGNAHLRDPKISDVDKFSGKKDDFMRFERKIREFLQCQPNTYRDDSTRIAYVGSRLTGSAETWYINQPSFTTFEKFWSAFQDMYFDKTARINAERLLMNLKLKPNANPTIKWCHVIPADQYAKFKDFCSSFGMCHICREYKGHNPNCRKADKNQSMLSLRGQIS